MAQYQCPNDGNDLVPDNKNLFFHCTYCGKDHPRYALVKAELNSKKARRDK